MRGTRLRPRLARPSVDQKRRAHEAAKVFPLQSATALLLSGTRRRAKLYSLSSAPRGASARLRCEFGTRTGRTVSRIRSECVVIRWRPPHGSSQSAATCRRISGARRLQSALHSTRAAARSGRRPKADGCGRGKATGWRNDLAGYPAGGSGWTTASWMSAVSAHTN